MAIRDDDCRNAPAEPPGGGFERAALLLALALTFGASGVARAGSLDDVGARHIGGWRHADYRPFGFRDEAGIIVEPDLASEIAKALAVKLKLVPVVATNRIALLKSGELDLVIATMNVTPERAKQVDFVEPNDYASGVNVLAPKTAHLHVWQQLKDKPVCRVESAAYLGQIKDRYGPDRYLYKNTDRVYAAVKAGECYAAYDDTAPVGQLQTPGWGDYEMPLRSVPLQPWGMAAKQGGCGAGVIRRRPGQEMARRRAHRAARKDLAHTALGLRRGNAPPLRRRGLILTLPGRNVVGDRSL